MNYLISIVLLISSSALAGTWERIDKSSLRFSGRIQSGDLENLEALLKNQDRTLYVNSKGGDAEVGLQMALKILPNKMTVIVDGFCASSCANYLFTAGHKKQIRKGWVGYHGNISALLAIDWDKSVTEMEEKYKLDDKQIEKMYLRLLESAKLEKAYFARIGVHQSLFDRTQTPDKKMGNGVSYTFLVPKPETFEKYGILNVSGTQNLAYGTDLGLNNLYD